VEAGPGGVDLLYKRLEDAAAEVAEVERCSGFVGEGDGGGVLIGLGREVGAQLRHERRRSTDLAATVLVLNPANPLPKRDSTSAPDRIRTCDLRFRRPTLYPTELLARVAGGEPGRAILGTWALG
jgi:hypothetical protein